MTLVSGTRLGQYEVIGRLGAGGMGEVYRARDTRLARDVALKILPPSFAIDPDRLARFEREARALAALNHPGIAQIYGFEEHDGLRAIAMELVEGATLADHLGRGPMELSRVVPIAAQLAEAMDFAHERGILHRDLKPSNITITPEGGAKVLDFGLAKAITGEADRSEASQAPTLTAGGTRAGMILGTAAYMSPEQARGREVDKRTDIWAFGCVLYEMLAGRAAFAADTVSDTLACVLERDPDWTRLPARTPTHVRRVLRLCLEKDIRTRLRDMGDARLMLEAGDEAATSPTAATRRVGAWAIAALLAGVLASASVLAGLWPRGTVLPAPVAFTLTPPDGEAFDGRVIPSPDAQQMAVVTRTASGRRVVWVRPTAHRCSASTRPVGHRSR
ncbi:MAG: serine/threonine-protein kinase [Acidobacteriota bacterium]